MALEMPVLHTERLDIRSFVPEDLEIADAVFSRAWGTPRTAEGLEQRRRWLQWASINPEGLASVSQPPYGDRALVLRETGELIGSVGLVPSLGPFGLVPGFPEHAGSPYWYPEVGLFWAVDPDYQGRGYATEGGRALIEYALANLHLGRIIATTTAGNEPSKAVMRKVGMTVLEYPNEERPWMAAVGVLAAGT